MSNVRAKGPSWWHLGRPSWIAVLKSTATQFKEDGVSNLAAVVTLRLVIALVPSLIAAVAISTFFISPADIEELVASAGEFIPAQSREFVTTTLGNIVGSEAGGVASIVGVLVGLLAASGAAAALVRALNTAYDAEEERGFIAQRLVSLAIVGALFIALVGMFAALVLGPSLIELLVPQVILDSPIRYLITVGRYLAAVAVLVLFFEFAFRIAPHRPRAPLGLPTPGAVAGVVGWLLLSYLFSLYVRIAGNYDAYGAAAGVVILLIWLNYSFTVLLMGAELDREIEVHLLRTAPGQRALAARSDGAAEPGIDEVTTDMPRHPGLVPPAATLGSAPTTSTAPHRWGPRPKLAGAAARTAGASLAGRLWGRMGR